MVRITQQRDFVGAVLLYSPPLVDVVILDDRVTAKYAAESTAASNPALSELRDVSAGAFTGVHPGRD
jgi:hypothetical protein